MTHNPIQTRQMRVGINRPNSVGVMTAENTTLDIIIGQPKATGQTVNIHGNYPSRYNHGVEQWNYFNKSSSLNKRMMRGGHLLFYSKLVALIALVSMVFAGLSIRQKYFVVIPIVFSLIYMILSIFNFHIGRTNGSLFSNQMCPIRRGIIQTMNEYYDIPLHGNIQNQFLLGIIQSNAALFAELKSQHHHSTVIEIMFYTPTYISYTKYIAKTLGEFFLFFCILFFAILMVSIT